MSNDIRSLVKEHRAFYDVSRYYVLLDERPVGLPASTRTIHSGFDVDIYGVRTEDNQLVMPPPGEYALGYAELQNIAEKVSRHAGSSSSLEVIPFSDTVVIDSRNHGKVEAMLRIRISHCRGLDQPAGPAEERALKEVEDELATLGIAHR